MRPEGWFLIACIKNHGINPAQYCRLKCIKAAKREPSHGYYDEVPILLFLFRVFRRGLFAKRPENPRKNHSSIFSSSAKSRLAVWPRTVYHSMGEIPSPGRLVSKFSAVNTSPALMGRAATMLLRAMALLGASLAVRCLWPSPRAAPHGARPVPWP